MPHCAASVDQMMMLIIAPATVVRSMTLESTIPLPIVAATFVPESTPRRFRTAAMMMAWRGVSERVPTTVAMAFGESVQPLTNSAPRINRRTRMRPTSTRATSYVNLCIRSNE